MRSDEEIIKEYLAGDDESLKTLIDKYTSSIYNFSARFVGVDNAKDITQDVFLKVWRNIKKFDSDKASFKTWIFRIARNTITDFLRKKKSVNFSSLDTEEGTFEENIPDEIILQDEIFSKLEDVEMLNKILDKIPINYREILVLYYQEDMTFKEIGGMLGKPLNTVKSYHHRALILLKGEIAPKL
jgi:RNA polymerase sigma-70 factor (ECF subfamily)